MEFCLSYTKNRTNTERRIRNSYCIATLKMCSAHTAILNSERGGGPGEMFESQSYQQRCSCSLLRILLSPESSDCIWTVQWLLPVTQCKVLFSSTALDQK